MIRINLLPIEYQAKSRRIPMPNKVSIIIYGAVIAMIAAGSVGYLRQSTALSELQLRRDIAAQEETRLAAQSRAIEKMEMRAAMLGDRIRLIENLQGQRFENVSWLNAVNRVLPTQLWMVQATRNMAGGHTTVEGVAEGYQPIAKLMEAMGGDRALFICTAHAGPKAGGRQNGSNPLHGGRGLD